MGEQNDDAENEGTPDHDEYDSVKEIGNSSVQNSNSSLALDDTDGNTSMGGDIIADLGDVKISVNCASSDQVMPPHRPRVRQTTETTMIMSNKSQNVHDFFTVPVEIEAGENEVEGKEFELDHSSDQKPASWGRGISDDFKNTIAKHWKTEITNFRVKTVAVSLFLFFACIAPAVSPLMILRDLFIFLKIIRKCRIFLIMFGVRFKITFGTMYSKITHHSIGTVEMLFGTASCGILFALFGGQPMMINGGTGPVLAFTGVLYKLSDSIGVPFLTFYAWCGLWVALFMILAAFADLNKIILFATRFTDEIFSFLIATIFIIDSLGSPFHEVGVFYYFKQDPLDVALLSLIACLGTTYIAYVLRGVKFSSYLWAGWMRNLFSDFAISIAIFVFTILANLGFPSIHLEELDVPSTVNPTYVCCHADCTTFYPADCPELETPFGPRPWRVNLLDLNGKTYVIFMAAGPALLAFILVFLDNGITMHLMNHPAHKIAHGSAYNYDTVVIGIMIAVCSLYGFPWLVAATVRSLNHLHALAEKSSDGKTFYSVHETRLTGLFAHCLILGSLFALDIIRLIPVPVLYGVFLYMGFTTLPSNQFWNRILLFFMQPSKYTDANNEVFIENVKTWRIHLYTIIQLSLFLLLFVIKSMKPIAIAFPIIIAAFIPIRLYIMPRLFTEDELILLDSGDDELIEEWLEEHGKSRTMKYVDPRSHNGLEVHHMSLCGSVRGSGSIRSMPSRSSSIVSALHA